MLIHLIERKGNGVMVIVLPLILAFVFFVIADTLSLNDKYIGAITLITSGIILFYLDNKREQVEDGIIVQRTIQMPRVESKNTLMWIEVRYWAIALSAIGLAWFIDFFL